MNTADEHGPSMILHSSALSISFSGEESEDQQLLQGELSVTNATLEEKGFTLSSPHLTLRSTVSRFIIRSADQAITEIRNRR